jgi:microcystin-dependent protein
MVQPFLGQVTLLGCNFAPVGWALCQGQIMSIQQNTALFSLLGTNFGGNGTSNFGLPDLRGRVPNSQGQGPGLSNYDVGEMDGFETVTLTTSTIPPHSHAMPAFAGAGTTNAPQGALTAEASAAGGRGGVTINSYAAPGTLVPLAPAQLTPGPGGNGPHNNLQPYLTLNWCIALTGIFPARN